MKDILKGLSYAQRFGIYVAAWLFIVIVLVFVGLSILPNWTLWLLLLPAIPIVLLTWANYKNNHCVGWHIEEMMPVSPTVAPVSYVAQPSV